MKLNAVEALPYHLFTFDCIHGRVWTCPWGCLVVIMNYYWMMANWNTLHSAICTHLSLSFSRRNGWHSNNRNSLVRCPSNKWTATSIHTSSSQDTINFIPRRISNLPTTNDATGSMCLRRCLGKTSRGELFSLFWIQSALTNWFVTFSSGPGSEKSRIRTGWKSLGRLLHLLAVDSITFSLPEVIFHRPFSSLFNSRSYLIQLNHSSHLFNYLLNGDQ